MRTPKVSRAYFETAIPSVGLLKSWKRHALGWMRRVRSIQFTYYHRWLHPAHVTRCQAANDLEEAIKKKVILRSPMRRTMSIPGVGPLQKLNSIALADGPGRFNWISDAGSFLGMMPNRYQSGEVSGSGGVAKCGDDVICGLLFEYASCLIR